MNTVFLVEDEKEFFVVLKLLLEKGGYATFGVHSLSEAKATVLNHFFDVVILDLGLPDGSGLDFLKSFRQWSTKPVLVLTANGSIDDKVNALDLGADDYLTKPFHAQELYARLRSLLRRHQQSDFGSQVYQSGELLLDFSQHKAWMRQKEVLFTAIEFELLKIFFKNPERVLSHDKLLREIWGPNASHHPEYLRVHIGQIRKKLSAKDSSHDYIKTEINVGYRWNSPVVSHLR